MHAGVSIDRIQRALIVVARLVETDRVYLPIFVRLDAELNAAEAADPIERARKIAAIEARQKAIV